MQIFMTLSSHIQKTECFIQQQILDKNLFAFTKPTATSDVNVLWLHQVESSWGYSSKWKKVKYNQSLSLKKVKKVEWGIITCIRKKKRSKTSCSAYYTVQLLAAIRHSLRQKTLAPPRGQLHTCNQYIIYLLNSQVSNTVCTLILWLTRCIHYSLLQITITTKTKFMVPTIFHYFVKAFA